LHQFSGFASFFLGIICSLKKLMTSQVPQRCPDLKGASYFCMQKYILLHTRVSLKNPPKVL
ncbi:MAG: hypothetical protein ACOH2A_14505, partial [Sphingobacteriaceae bacterium]